MADHIKLFCCVLFVFFFIIFTRMSTFISYNGGCGGSDSGGGFGDLVSLFLFM